MGWFTGWVKRVNLVINEILTFGKQGWILEKLSKNFRQYFNIRNRKQHKTIIETLKLDADPTSTWQVGQYPDD